MNAFDLYLRRGVVYLPTTAKVLTGGGQEIEPVEKAAISDETALRQAIRETLARGNPVLASYSYADNPEPWVIKSAKVKSFGEFAQGTLLWIIVEKDGAYEIRPQKKVPYKGWIPDPDRKIALPEGSDEGDLIDRMIAVLNEASAK
jgi:hypothetical protein